VARQQPGGWQRGLTTTQRGLGGGHQAQRQAALAALKDGDPCERCRRRGVYHPMWRALVSVSPATGRLVAPALELDDFPSRVVARALGVTPVKALSWRRCNRHAGGVLGNQIKALRQGKQPKPVQYTRW
jgi:hypothetical protein